MTPTTDAADERRRIGSRPRPVGEYFAVERPLLHPLPGEPFETGRLFSLRVDRFSQVSVRTNRYSVPVRLIGRTARVMLHASELVATTGRRKSPGTSASSPKVRPDPCWTTTWRPWSRSPAPSRAPPPWNRRSPRASSPRSMTPGGPRPARPTGTGTAPGL
ncbi:Mu transposase domain-containing protein [Streptomyces hawaiiensis]